MANDGEDEARLTQQYNVRMSRFKREGRIDQVLSMFDLMAEAGIKPELSPPYVHEGVGLAEIQFHHRVPAANALLLAAPDLGEQHFTGLRLDVAHHFTFIVRHADPEVLWPFGAWSGTLRECS